MQYNNVWYSDGSLRDICITSATISDWQRLVEWLHTNPYAIEFYLDDRQAPLPREVSEIFEQRNDVGVLLCILSEDVTINCHFFQYKEIEFNIDPRQVDSEQKERGIIDFMRALGRLLNMEVLLTPENWRATAFLTYLPEQDEFVHNPISLAVTETRGLSREEGLSLMARAYGVDENDEEAILQKMLEAANKPAFEET